MSDQTLEEVQDLELEVINMYGELHGSAKTARQAAKRLHEACCQTEDAVDETMQRCIKLIQDLELKLAEKLASDPMASDGTARGSLS